MLSLGMHALPPTGVSLRKRHALELFAGLPRHYDSVASELSLKGWAARTPRRHNTILVPISGVHAAVLQAIEYAKTLSPDVRAVYVNVDPVVPLRFRWR